MSGISRIYLPFGGRASTLAEQAAATVAALGGGVSSSCYRRLLAVW
jgi:hypothetical protein